MGGWKLAHGGGGGGASSAAAAGEFVEGLKYLGLGLGLGLRI